MGCNCGGRSGGRATGTVTAGSVGVWRHTDPLGGKVDYHDKARADAAVSVRGGSVELVDPRTGNPLTPK